MANKEKTKNKGKNSAKNRLMLCVAILTSVAILPTTILFFVGMMPSIVAKISDRTKEKTRVMTVGFLNFATCFPFWFQLMQRGHKFDGAVAILLDPLNIVIMYGGALGGYLIEWCLAGFVANIMAQKGRKRLDAIKKTQEELITRWGREVSGDIPIDIHGFPVSPKEK